MSEHPLTKITEVVNQLTDMSRPATMGASRDSEERAEWREWLGQKLMTTMLCTHEFDGAICETCFENTQRIGALIEDEMDARLAVLQAAPSSSKAGSCSGSCSCGDGA